MTLGWTLITQWITNKKRSIVSKDHTFFTDAEEVLVFWKWKILWRKIHEVWDGMDVIVWFDRELHSVELMPWLIENWLWLYQEFNEDLNKVVSYLYGFWNDSDSIELMNELLADFWIENTVIVDWKFTVFEKPITSVDQKSIQTIDWLVSILIWMILWYWSFVWDDETLFNATIQLPMAWSIAQYEELFEWITYLLKEQWLYMRSEYVDHKSQQVRSVWIHDWELLSLLKNALWDERVVWKMDEATNLLTHAYEITWREFSHIKLFNI